MSKHIDASHAPVTRTKGLQPKGNPPVRRWSVMLGVVLLALSFVAAREAWVVSGGTGHRSWVNWFLNTMATQGVQDWMLWAGPLAMFVGLIFLVVALRRRPATHLDYSSESTSMWLRPVDIARKASGAARSVPGVAAARTTASKKQVSVIVNGDIDDPTLEQRVTEAVSETLTGLQSAPPLTVTLEKIQEADTHV